jgi:hypothetical protein
LPVTHYSACGHTAPLPRRTTVRTSLVTPLTPHRIIIIAHNVADHRHTSVARLVTVHSSPAPRCCSSSSSSCRDFPLELALRPARLTPQFAHRDANILLYSCPRRAHPPSSTYLVAMLARRRLRTRAGALHLLGHYYCESSPSSKARSSVTARPTHAKSRQKNTSNFTITPKDYG